MPIPHSESLNSNISYIYDSKIIIVYLHFKNFFKLLMQFVYPSYCVFYYIHYMQCDIRCIHRISTLQILFRSTTITPYSYIVIFIQLCIPLCLVFFHSLKLNLIVLCGVQWVICYHYNYDQHTYAIADSEHHYL